MITYDRYQRIKEIFFSAQDYDTPAERSAFLTEACGNDRAMREELESLLTAHEDNDDFLSSPAYELAAGMLADESREFSHGQEVGQYKIECFLSSGGMGQIYAAHDTKLGRKVALKFISPEFATDYRRVQRFEREARAASALNHPNVCVIHDVGVTDHGRHFIAMEFIVGTTLRDELVRRRIFKPQDALEIAIQVGDALASAHAKGIVHRDIKPENIMLRPDGYVKVVDFGLAKLTELLPDPERIEESQTIVHTEPRTIMGTVKYMSPEQLREAPVDERTDIWSLGIVLYEMLTGATPFDARAPNDSIALILRSTELQFPDDIPTPLRDIVKKALEKDCTQRYQAVTELTAELRKLKWQWEHSHEDRTSAPVLSSSDDENKTKPVILTRLRSQALSTADFLISEIKTHKSATIFACTTSVLALLLLFLLPRWPSSSPRPAVTMQQLTQSGTTVFAVASPDGNWIAHAEQENGKQQLVVMSPDRPDKFTAMPPERVQYLGASFSHDNNFLYFTRTERGDDGKDSDGLLYQLALHGGKPTKLKEGVDSAISLSPEDDRLAFVSLDEATAEYSLRLSNLDGTNEQVIARRKDGDTFSLHGPAWSPDGSMIVCPAGVWSNGWRTNLIGFDVKTGREQLIANRSWFAIQGLAWDKDTKALFLSAKSQEMSPYQLWRIPFPNGAPEEITTDVSEYTSVSLAGDRIVTVRSDRQWRIWVLPVDDLLRASVIEGGIGLNIGIDWTSTGKILYSSRSQDRLNIYAIDPDGSNKVQLTANAGDNFSPSSSADGRYYVFVSNRTGLSNIWRMNADGSNPIQLSKGEGNYYPKTSPDNEWVAYDNLLKSTASVWKVPLAGDGEPVKVAEKYRMPVFSPNNQYITCRFDCPSGTHEVAIFPAQGGDALGHFTVPMQEWQSVQYLNDHKVSYVQNVDGYSNIRILDLDTRTSTQLTDFRSEQIYAYAWSPDRKQIAILRGPKMNNVTILSSER